MYHKTNFGNFSVYLEPFSDLMGFIPEEGDHHEAMQWDTEWDEESWEEFVSMAESMKEYAEEELEDWRVYY